MVTASGLWAVALIGTASTLLILTLGRRLEAFVPRPSDQDNDH